MRIVEVVVFLNDTMDDVEVLHMQYDTTKEEAVKAVSAEYGENWFACEVIKDGVIL